MEGYLMEGYLAGGMRSTWQDKVKNEFPEIQWHDPREHGLSEPREYTAWDLDKVRSSAIVFAYFTKDNPSGFGMSAEIGYARALNKLIILVDEQDIKYWAMVHEMCDYWTEYFEAACVWLRHWLDNITRGPQY